MKNMADYTMEDDKWNNHVSTIEGDLENREGLEPEIKNAIETFLMMGNTSPDSRQKWWQNIRNIYSTLENSPIGTGPRKVYPADVVKNVDSMCAVYKAGYHALFATDLLFGEVERKRGKAGGAAYVDAEEFAQARSNNLESRLYGYYKNHTEGNTLVISWDGTLDNKTGLPTLVLPVIPDAEETPEVDG